MSKSDKIPSLDGIRGFAIALVLVWHVPVKALWGHVPNHPLLSRIVNLGRFTWSGVDLFFVLSSFLIGGILLDSAQSPSYLSTFYIRRAYRILPLYGVILISTLVVYGTNQWVWPKVTAELSWFLLFLQNFRTAATGVYAFTGLSMTWSLAVEEQFYMTLPFVVRFVNRCVLWRLLIGIVLAAPVLRIFVVNVLKLPLIASYILTPCRADTLCLGVLIAMATRTPQAWEKITAHRKYIYVTFAAACCLGARMLIGSFQPFTERLFGLEYSLLALIYALLLLCTPVSPVLSSLFSFRPLRFLGSIAYGLYLFHGMVAFVLFSTLERLGRSSSQAAVFLTWFLSVPVSIALAAISWKYFEKPLVKRGHRYQYWDEPGQLEEKKRAARSRPTMAPQALAPKEMETSL